MISAGRGRDFLSLTKPRLGLLVLFATATGFCMASGGRIDLGRLAFALLGTALVSGGASVLNQVAEMRWDRLMTRTRDRPLAAGRVARPAAFRFGAGMAVAGLGCLGWGTTALAAGFAAVALGIYLAGYTPMKRYSAGCVLVGAVAGAMPPVIGWAAAGGVLKWQTGVLFGVLFAWQMPHLAAIAWRHRDDYANAGFAFLLADDPGGRTLALQSFAFSGLLTGITFIPVLMGTAGAGYCVGTLLLDGLLLVGAGLFVRERSRESARRLFMVSMVYLPAFLTLLLFARR